MMVLPAESPISNLHYAVSSFFSSYKPIKHGQMPHELWQIHGAFVHVLQLLHQSFNSFFKQSLTVLKNGRAYLVFSGLQTITCSICDKTKFYVKIQTRVESEILSVLSGKFVCPKCKRAKE